MRVLGSTVCPEVVALLPSGYVMEYAAPAERSPGLLREIESALDCYVWSSRLQSDDSWIPLLEQRVGVSVPTWLQLGDACVTHGDCTVSNALCRDNGLLIVCDAFPRRPHVAPSRMVDCGRILQSAAGWETMLHGDAPVEWLMPDFWRAHETRRTALWWLGVTALRLAVTERARGGEQRDHVLRWCEAVAEGSFQLCT